MKLLVGNFKNKLNRKENEDYSRRLENVYVEDYSLVIAPSIPFTYLYDGFNYKLASQDISSYIEGTITGEITGEQLKSMGCRYVLVGHSERRTYCNEINISFINKINNAHESGINIIYCIGESLNDRKNGHTYEILEKQIDEVLNNVDIKNITIAYEPTYVIGTGYSLNKKDIIDTIKYIKDITFKQYEANFKVIYGGGVNKDTVANLKNEKTIDGFLVGSSSFNPDNFLAIIDEINS